MRLRAGVGVSHKRGLAGWPIAGHLGTELVTGAVEIMLLPSLPAPTSHGLSQNHDARTWPGRLTG